MNDKNFVLVRSPKELIEKGQIGYGWEVDFSKYDNANSLIEDIDKKCGIGRKRKQVERYFNLKENDIVIVPLSGAIVIAEVIGEKSFQLNPDIKFSENRVTVEYLSDKEGGVYYIPRKSLSTELQSRLKLRMSVASLNDFSEEIEKHVESLKKEEQLYSCSLFIYSLIDTFCLCIIVKYDKF